MPVRRGWRVRVGTGAGIDLRVRDLAEPVPAGQVFVITTRYLRGVDREECSLLGFRYFTRPLKRGNHPGETYRRQAQENGVFNLLPANA